jgi:uncharacterized RDD family membrane protein YckC
MAFGTRTDLAGLTSRLIALLIDGAIFGAGAALLVGGSRSLGTVTSFVLGFMYQWYFLTRRDGATIGKSLAGIRVVKADGSKLTGMDVFLRYIGYYINNVFFLGWVWAIFNKNSQGWHDKIAGTVVVRAR